MILFDSDNIRDYIDACKQNFATFVWMTLPVTQ
jgi:hypothetical protein